MNEETKKIKLKMFIACYRKQVNDSLKEKYLENNLKVVRYVPYEQKLTFAQRIVDFSCYRNEGTDEEPRIVFHVDTPMREFLFQRSLIELYTNLEIDNDAFLEHYNALEELGVMDYIFAHIPEEEIVAMHNLVDMVFSDEMTNNYEIHGYIKNQISRIIDVGSMLLEPVLEKVSQKIDALDKKDAERLMKRLEKAIAKSKEFVGGGSE